MKPQLTSTKQEAGRGGTGSGCDLTMFTQAGVSLASHSQKEGALGTSPFTLSTFPQVFIELTNFSKVL